MISMYLFKKHYSELVRFGRFLRMKLQIHTPVKIAYTAEIDFSESTATGVIRGVNKKGCPFGTAFIT